MVPTMQSEAEGKYPLTLRSYGDDLKLLAGTRALRGGSWSDFDRNCRAACRYGNDPVNRDLDVGFRVVELLSDPES